MSHYLLLFITKSCLTLCNIYGHIAHQGPLSMKSSRQEYWSGLSFPPPGDLPNPGIKPRPPVLQDYSPSEPPGKPCLMYSMSLTKFFMPSPKPALSVVSFRNYHPCSFCFSSKKPWCYLLLSHTPHLIHQIHHELLILGKTRKEGNLGVGMKKLRLNINRKQSSNRSICKWYLMIQRK